MAIGTAFGRITITAGCLVRIIYGRWVDHDGISAISGLATGAFNADEAPDIDLTDAATEQVSSVTMRIHQTAILLGLSLATSGLWGGDNPS